MACQSKILYRLLQSLRSRHWSKRASGRFGIEKLLSLPIVSTEERPVELESFPPISKILPGFEYCLVRFTAGNMGGLSRHIRSGETRGLKPLLESFKFTGDTFQGSPMFSQTSIDVSFSWPVARIVLPRTIKWKYARGFSILLAILDDFDEM